MPQYTHIIIMLLTGIGFYYLIDSKVVYPLLSKLLNGPLNSWYASYIQQHFKRMFSSNAGPNPDDAWYILAFKKIYEMGLSSVSTQNRAQNLVYLKNKSPDPELLDELISVLPKQTDRDFQIKLASFIEDWVKKVKTLEKKEHVGFQSFSPKNFIGNWSRAFSAWLTGAFLAIYIWVNIETFNINSIILISLLFCLFMSLPAIRLALSGFVKSSSIFIVTAVVLSALGAYPVLSHSKINSYSSNLANYGYPDASMAIRYPMWLTDDDATACDAKRSVVVQTEGLDQSKLKFRYDQNRLLLKDNSCHASSAEFSTGNFEFYLVPLTKDTLLHEEVLEITPVLDDGKDIRELSNFTMTVRMEHPFWNIVHDAALILIPSGFSGLLFLRFFLGKRKIE